jgi:hypothetical protein
MAMEPAIDQMDPEDRVILRMRFWHGAKVPEIAAALCLDQKKLYKRIEKLSAMLGEALQRAGFGRDDAAELLAHGDHNLTLSLEKRNRRPSNGADGESERAHLGGRVDHSD